MPESPSTRDLLMDLRQTIKDGFQADPLGDVQGSIKSATEMGIRDKRAQRTAMTDIGRLLNELPAQIYETSLKILMEKNLINLKQFSKKWFRFSFQSPLYDIEKAAQVQSLIENVQIKDNMAGQGAALMTMNVGEISDFLTEAQDLPAKLFKSGDEVNQKMKNITDNATQQQQQQQGQQQPMQPNAAPQVGMP